MTENEAFEIIEKKFLEGNGDDKWISADNIQKIINSYTKVMNEIQKHEEPGKNEFLADMKSNHVGILSELKQYRNLGTIEFLTDMKSNYVETLSDLRQYQKLGTVEELKEDKAIADELSAIEAAKFYAVISEWKKYQEIGTMEECQENKAIAEETSTCGKWILCSKKLPEKRIDILVSFNDNDNLVIAWYSEVNKCWKNSSTDNVITSKVIAWQQLPEPYKEGEKN